MDDVRGGWVRCEVDVLDREYILLVVLTERQRVVSWNREILVDRMEGFLIRAAAEEGKGVGGDEWREQERERGDGEPHGESTTESKPNQ